MHKVTERSVTLKLRMGVWISMGARRGEDGKTRKEQILAAAFSLTTAGNRWSLADVALAVGVSKTALYRHFRDKDELLREMDNALLDRIVETINAAPSGRVGVSNAVVSFFRENPGYFYRIHSRIAEDPLFVESAIAAIRDRCPLVGAVFAEADQFGAQKKAQFRLGLLKGAVTVFFASHPQVDCADCPERILEWHENGLPSLAVPSDGRLDALERACSLDESEFQDETPILEAIASVIAERGIANTTIERIAERMGTAKSSLYFYYKNKEEMLNVLLQNHIRRIESLTGRIVPSGRDLAEQLYISVALQTNYLILQPNSIPVFNWIHYEMTTDGDRESVTSADLAEFLSHYRVDELGPDKERFIYVLKWAMVLASATVSQGMRFIDDPKKLRLAVRDMFKRILRGEKEIS